MIHIYVASIVLVLVFMFSSNYARVSGGVIKSILEVFKAVSGVALVICLVLIFCMIEHRDDFFKSLPFTSIENSSDIEVDTSGVMLLSETSGAQVHEDFILTDDLKLDELAEWLDNRYSNVDIFVKKGSTIIYTKSLGRVDKRVGSEVLGYYNQWRNEGTLPRQEVRYKFLCFYMDV